MAESLVQVTEGSGKKLHTNQRTIGANNVEDEIVVLGEPYLASYTIGFTGVSIATANDHVLQIMAGASLKVRIRRICIWQIGLAGAAGMSTWIIHRLSTAGTGGTAVGPRQHETTDAASGATAMTLPTAKGTEGVFLQRWAMAMAAAHPVTVPPYQWGQLPNQKPITIEAGTTNGIAIKSVTAVAGATVAGYVEIDETSF